MPDSHIEAPTNANGGASDAPPERTRMRLLVFVIAYQAETTLKWVLERIPSRIFEEHECEILVIDDGSADRTFEIGCAYRDAHPEIPLTVLRNEFNQGYGGNQKVGYAYALAEGFDLVAMVHGDGQYAPEELPRLIEPFVRGTADAVFGSRMMTRFDALAGGMPLYKYVGNRILTTFQNALLGTALSEFHSGYRIYATRALRAIPFRLNSNDFHFDTEIIIQLLRAKMRIVELPIPTYYGDEICRVNGMKYAKDVAVATSLSVAHGAGLLYQRRFDVDPEGNAHYDLKLGYTSSHSLAIDAVPVGARVLDLGSGPMGVASELAQKGCEVAVVDRCPPPEHAADPSVKVVVQDLDDPIRFEVDGYDHILMLDIVEHLRDPEAFLDGLRRHFDFRPRRVILTTPNVAFVVQRLMLLGGQFNYGKAGILDRTHTRLFTFASLERLLEDTGLRVRTIRGIPAPFPKVLGNGALGKLAIAANEALIAVRPELFSYQIYVEADTTPDVEFVLERARRSSAVSKAPTAADD